MAESAMLLGAMALGLGGAVALAWLLRRPQGADESLLQQNRQLHDLLMAMLGDERGWLAHRRESDRIALERQQAAWEATPPRDRPPYGPMAVEPTPEGRSVSTPAHGAM